MVLYICHHASMVEEGMDWIGRVMDYVPKFHGFVIRPWSHHSRVKRKLRAPHPVLMSSEALDKLALIHIPDFNELVVTRGDKQRSIRVKCDWLDWRRMSFHYCARRRRIVGPDSDSLISRARRNQSTAVIYGDICDWSLVALKFIRPRIWSEAPSEDETIIWAWNDLFQRRMENCFGYFVFVTLQWF